MKRPLILIPDGDCSFATHVVRALSQEKGWDVCVLSKVSRAAVTYSRHCTRWDLLSCSMEEYHSHFAEILEEKIRALRPDVLLPIHEQSIRLTGLHLERLRASVAVAAVPRPETFDIVVDKARMAEYSQLHDLPHPPTIFSNHAEELIDRCETLTFPVLVKARSMGFGEGIFRFDSPVELILFLRQGEVRADEVVIQQVIPGSDIDCSVLCEQGEVLAWTIQAPLHEPGRNFKPPKSIQFIEDDRVLGVARNVMRALNWSGIAHLDLRYDATREHLYLLEINARYWGSLPGSIRAGVNFPALACRRALALPWPEVHQLPSRYSTAAGYLADLCTLPHSAEPRLSSHESAFQQFLSDPWPEMAQLTRLSKV